MPIIDRIVTTNSGCIDNDGDLWFYYYGCLTKRNREV